MATIRQLSDGGPDGTKVGQSTTDKVGFYGVTPVVQQTYTQTAVTAIVTTTFTEAKTGIWGFSSSTVAASYKTRVNQLVVDVDKIHDRLVTLGLLV